MDEDRSSPCFIWADEHPQVRQTDITAICKPCDKTMIREGNGLAVTTNWCLILLFNKISKRFLTLWCGLFSQKHLHLQIKAKLDAMMVCWSQTDITDNKWPHYSQRRMTILDLSRKNILWIRWSLVFNNTSLALHCLKITYFELWGARIISFGCVAERESEEGQKYFCLASRKLWTQVRLDMYTGLLQCLECHWMWLLGLFMNQNNDFGSSLLRNVHVQVVIATYWRTRCPAVISPKWGVCPWCMEQRRVQGGQQDLMKYLLRRWQPLSHL